MLVAEKPLGTFLPKFTFEPPLYYIFLHFWIKLFGTSEIAIRSLSLLGFSLATIVVIHWAEKLFKKHWLSWLLPILFFLNPMLLYYAFEVRAYGWYIFFATVSMYAYIQKQWILYILATVLGFYTHTYMIFVPITQVIHWFISFSMIHANKILHIFHKKYLYRLIREPFLQASLISGLCIFPWLLRILSDAGRLKQSWYFPVDGNLVTSVLGNMFLGYEGTPWYLWGFTKILSILLLFFFLLALRRKETRMRNIYFFLSVLVPLTLVIGVSFIKPLFVNRYLIPVSIAEVFLLAFALDSIASKVAARALGWSIVVGLVAFNLWYPPQHSKLDIRRTIMQVNALKTPSDIIFADSPLVFFESIYYSRDRSRVFLYNPNNSAFPWYVGDIIVSHEQMARDFPAYPKRTFLVHENGTFDVRYQLPVPIAQK